MALQRVSLVVYTRFAGPQSPSPWAGHLSYGAHRRVVRGSVHARCELELEAHAITEALAALKRPCAVDVYQCCGTLKEALGDAQQGAGIRERLGAHSIQWYWWAAAPESPQYVAARRCAEEASEQ